MLTKITVRFDAETLISTTGLTIEELESVETDLDVALTNAVRAAFPEVENVSGVAFYVSMPTVEAYDEDGNQVDIVVDFMTIVNTAINSIENGTKCSNQRLSKFQTTLTHTDHTMSLV